MSGCTPTTWKRVARKLKVKKKAKENRKDKIFIDAFGLTGENGGKSNEDTESQDIVKVLSVKCNLSEEEVIAAYKEFNAENPDGVITKEQFLLTMKDQLIGESLFRVFDEDNSGSLNFSEYLQVKSVKTVNTAEEKLNWIFTAFDQDGGGTIDVEEITEIVLGCFRMAGIEEDDEMLPSCVEDVRASIDVDGDGDISKEEFVKNALKNKFIARLLKYEN